MQSSCVKRKLFQALIAVPNKGALTLSTPKVSKGKRNPDASVCRQMGFNRAPAQAANGPELQQGCYSYFFSAFCPWVPPCVKVTKPNE